MVNDYRKIKSIVMVYCLVITSFFILLSTDVLVDDVQAAWWNSDWDYYKECNIDDAINSYVVKLVVGQNTGDGGDVHTENHCQDDFGDIRFLDIDNSTVLDYWIENSTSGVQATFWIELPADAATDNKILIYYGTTGTSSTTSSGANTFLWWEGNGASYGDWGTQGGTGSVSDSGDWLKFDSTSSTKREWELSVADFYNHASSFIMECWFKKDVVSDGNSNMLLFPDDGTTPFDGDWTSLYAIYIKDAPEIDFLTYDTAQRWLADYTDNTERYVEIRVNLTTDKAGWYIDKDASCEGWWNFRETNEINYFSGIYVALDDSDDFYFKNWRTRPWTTGTEPSWSSFGNEQTEGPGATVPVVTTNDATGVEETNATIRGTLTNNGSADTTCWFQYGDETPPTDNNVSQGVIAHGASFSYNWDKLTPGILYYFDTEANNSEGWDETGGIKSFLTKPDPPTHASCSAGEGWINVSWTVATGADKYLVRYKSGSSPTSITDGTEFGNVTVLYVNDTLGAGTYYFSIWSYAYESSPALHHYSDTYDTTSGTELSSPTWYSSSFGGSVTISDEPSTYTIKGLEGADKNITWTGDEGTSIWSNTTAGAGGTMEINMSINTTDNVSEIRINLTHLSIAQGIYNTNVSLQVSSDNTSWGTNVTQYDGRDYKQYNFSIRDSVWTEQNGFYGTNPFSGAGLTDKNTSIFVRFRLAIPSGASSGTYSQSDWDVYLGYDTRLWYDDGTTTDLAKVTGRNFHGNSVIQLANSDLYVAHYNSTTHSAGDNYSAYRSTDGGVTWVGTTDIWKIGSESVPYGVVNSGLGLAPNSTIVCLLQTRSAYDTVAYYGLRIKHSYDNGSTWVDKGWLNTTNPNASRHMGTRILTVENTMYAPTYTHEWAGTRRLFSVYTSTDNGTSWSLRGIVLNTSDNENSYCTLEQMANGSFLWMNHHDNNGMNYYSISEDDCVTWTTPIDSGTNIRDPDLNRLGDNYFLHGRDKDASSVFGFWYSTDGITWTNETTIDDGGAHEAYSSGVMVNNDLFLTYSKQYDAGNDWNELRYYWIYNVTNMTNYDSLDIGGKAIIGSEIDVSIENNTWDGGNPSSGQSFTTNCTFWQNGSANLDVVIVINSTNSNYTLVNYTDYDATDEYAGNFTTNAWSTETSINVSIWPPNTYILQNFATGSQLLGFRIWVPTSFSSDKREDFEVILVATEHT